MCGSQETNFSSSYSKLASSFPRFFVFFVTNSKTLFDCADGSAQKKWVLFHPQLSANKYQLSLSPSPIIQTSFILRVLNCTVRLEVLERSYFRPNPKTWHRRKFKVTDIIGLSNVGSLIGWFGRWIKFIGENVACKSRDVMLPTEKKGYHFSIVLIFIRSYGFLEAVSIGWVYHPHWVEAPGRAPANSKGATGQWCWFGCWGSKMSVRN